MRLTTFLCEELGFWPNAKKFSHARKLRDGANGHLPHNSRSVHLDRLLGRTESRADLLIHSACNEVPEHLVLARSQRRHTSRYRVRRNSTASRLTIALQSPSDGADQNGFVPWFLEKVQCAGTHRLSGRSYAAVATQKNYGLEAASFDQPFLQLETRGAGQHDVEQDAARRIGTYCLEKSDRRVVRLNEKLETQQPRERQLSAWIGVDHENARLDVARRR
jgi:hypothetical protein